MSARLKKLDDEAFRLPPRARARLEAWKIEAQSRAKEIASGNAKVISAAKVFKKARAMLS
jgi:hypothetical protein